MENIYIKELKKILENYYATAQKLNNQKKQNNEYYSPDIAETANKKVDAHLNDAYEQTRKAINAKYLNVREILAKGTFYSASELTDVKAIFESGLELSTFTVRGYIEKAEMQGNFTMLAYIKNWIEKQLVAGKNEYATINVFYPIDHLYVYKKLSNRALHITDLIHQNKQIMQNPLEIVYFGKSDISDAELNTISNGERIYINAEKSVPEIVNHTFDDYTLDGFSE